MEKEKEFTVKQLSDDADFPWKERSIRKFIKSGELRAKRYGVKKQMITESAINEFMEKNAEIVGRK